MAEIILNGQSVKTEAADMEDLKEQDEIRRTKGAQGEGETGESEWF